MQVLVLDGEGKALSVTKGLVTAGELQQSLSTGLAAFSNQVASSFSPIKCRCSLVQWPMPSLYIHQRQMKFGHAVQAGQSRTTEQPSPVVDNVKGTACWCSLTQQLHHLLAAVSFLEDGGCDVFEPSP